MNTVLVVINGKASADLVERLAIEHFDAEAYHLNVPTRGGEDFSFLLK